MSEKRKIAILTGAGFSRDWGGLLTNEITYRALAYPGLSRKARECLLKSNGNFELALAEEAGEVLKAVEFAFDFHERLLKGRTDQVGPEELRKWLENKMSTHEICWFTINYDLLVERHGCSTGQTKLSRPGAAEPFIASEQFAKFRVLGASESPATELTELGAIEWSCNAIQYIKLHGSLDWKDANGKRLIIAGKDKVAQIEGSPLGQYYKRWKEFTPGSRIICIGYGFMDWHLNEQLFASGSKFVSINPKGQDVISANRPAFSNPLCSGDARKLAEDLELFDSLVEGFYKCCSTFIVRPPQEVLKDLGREDSKWRIVFDEFVDAD